MKSIYRVVLSFGAVIFLCNCTKMISEIEPVFSDNMALNQGIVDSDLDSSLANNLKEGFLVKEKDILAYLQYKKNTDETKSQEVDITPILTDQGDTVMYVINYNNSGWEILAADKRCKAVVAFDNDGRFDIDEQIPPIQTWIRGIGEDIMRVRSISSYDSIEDKAVVDNMKKSEVFWKMITADPDYLQSKITQTKSGLDPIPYGDGHWEATEWILDTVSYQLVNHLVQTHWDQGYPYNSYCPLKSYSTTERTPAGCVAIAAGQVANYLNKQIGNPLTAPLTAFCDAQVSPYSYYQASSGDPHMYVSDMSSTAWSSIPASGDMCAKLISEIGIAENMIYTDNTSLAAGLGETYFANHGFSYSKWDINYDALIDNVTSGKPVIVGAYDSNNNNQGHAFIVDAYRYVRTKLTTYYVWVSDDTYSWSVPVRFEEEFLTDEAISMNWGWGGSYDTVWFNLYNNWVFSGHNFSTINRKMLYNLTSLLPL